MINYTATSPDAWEALCIEQFQLCRLDWTGDSFGADLRASAALPRLPVRLLASGPFGVSRTLRDIRRHDSDDLMVVLHESGGQGHMEHKGRRSVLRPGDAVVIDTRRPYTFNFPRPIKQSVLKIPQELAARLAPKAGHVLCATESPLGRVLETVVRELSTLDTATTRGTDQAGNDLEALSLVMAAVDLVAAIGSVNASRSSDMLGHEALLKSGQEFVRGAFRNPALSPALMAEHLRVSPRLLAQIFSRAGMTPAAFIRDVRLSEATRLLRSRHHREVPVFDVGLRVGFTDATTFTRAFKRVHGVVPSEFREMQKAAVDSSRPIPSNNGMTDHRAQ